MVSGAWVCARVQLTRSEIARDKNKKIRKRGSTGNSLCIAANDAMDVNITKTLPPRPTTSSPNILESAVISFYGIVVRKPLKSDTDDAAWASLSQS